MNDEDRSMPPLIAFAGALGGLAVVRWVAEAAKSNDIPTLRRDPNTGAYRPG
jgi:hypothetical protein